MPRSDRIESRADLQNCSASPLRTRCRERVALEHGLVPGGTGCLRRSERVAKLAGRRSPEPCAQVRILLGAQVEA
jgi:hypothetical protein